MKALGDLRKGASVLVHSASGGCGLQVCLSPRSRTLAAYPHRQKARTEVAGTHGDCEFADQPVKPNGNKRREFMPGTPERLEDSRARVTAGCLLVYV